MAEDWTESEIDAVVADYFGMLADELADRPFVKLARYRSLTERIPRNIKSIERKHQNISAIMIGFGQPWITGLKPSRRLATNNWRSRSIVAPRQPGATAQSRSPYGFPMPC